METFKNLALLKDRNSKNYDIYNVFIKGSEGKSFTILPRDNRVVVFKSMIGLNNVEFKMDEFTGFLNSSLQKDNREGLYYTKAIKEEDIKVGDWYFVYYVYAEFPCLYELKKIRTGVMKWLFGKYQVIRFSGADESFNMLNSNSLYRIRKDISSALNTEGLELYQLKRQTITSKRVTSKGRTSIFYKFEKK